MIFFLGVFLYHKTQVTWIFQPPSVVSKTRRLEGVILPRRKRIHSNQPATSQQNDINKEIQFIYFNEPMASNNAGAKVSSGNSSPAGSCSGSSAR
mmetsp:Transcript_8019/g.11606  ORF Transcript_8019/g.11606 Transcript_8019/m.11606 type:complete len:95 (-) Transcript_8019:466-750(-)